MSRLKIVSAVLSFAILPTLLHASPPLEPSRFSVEIIGDGQDVICIPGLTSSRRIFRPMAEKMKEDFRFHLVQVSGFSDAAARGNAKGEILAGIADELAEYITINRIMRPILVGHSLGGEVSLLIASKHPDKVGKLIVVDALPYFPLVFNPNATVENVAASASGFRESLLAMDAATFKSLQAESVKRLVKSESHHAEVLNDSLTSDRNVMARAVFEMMTLDLRPMLGKIEAPLTVIYAYDNGMGRSAAAVGELYRNSYADVKNVEFQQIDDSYHFIMLDQPDRFFDAIQARLESK
jgi:pimeloyl-ACP methyl ester carboxylesterase